MSSLDRAVKRRAEQVSDRIVDKLGGTPFHQAVNRLCIAVANLLPAIPPEHADELGRALGDLQEASLSQTTSTASATIVAAAGGLRGEVAALREELHTGIGELKQLLTAHLREHEAGGR